MTFRVGMKVVCVKDPAPNQIWAGIHSARRGRIYTICEIYIRPTSGKLGLRFVEHDNPILPDGNECGYLASRFRPLVDSKTEVSFTEANPAPEDSRQWDNRRPVVEPMPVDGWRVSVKT